MMEGRALCPNFRNKIDINFVLLPEGGQPFPVGVSLEELNAIFFLHKDSTGIALLTLSYTYNRAISLFRKEELK